MGPNSSARGRQLLVVTLACALLLGAVGPAMAAPLIYIQDVDLESDVALVGEPTNVTLQMANSGDSGALTVTIRANGTRINERTVQVDANSERRVNITATVNEPGRYRIKANNQTAGWLEVRRAVAETTNDRADGRTSEIRGREIAEGSILTAPFEASPNATLAIESMTMQVFAPRFNRTVDVYAPADAAPFDVPNGTNSTTFGAVTAESLADVEHTSMTVALDRAALNDSGFAPEDITFYRVENGTYAPVDTDLLATDGDSVTYRTNATLGEGLVLGSLSPDFEVRNRSFSTGDVEGGQELRLTLTVANTGAVDGNYTGSMEVNGEPVTETTTDITAGETSQVTLTYVVTEAGEYRVRSDGQSIATVFVTQAQTGDSTPEPTESTPEPTESESTPEPNERDTATSTDRATDTAQATTEAPDGTATTDAGGTESGPVPIPDVGTREAAIGVGIAVLGGGLVLLSRR